MALQIRRGPNAQRATTLLQVGEVAWTTDTKKLYVGDGVTTGGVNILANIAGTGFVWNPVTEQLDLAGSTITGITADNVSETNGVVPRLWYRSSLGKQHASEIFTTLAGAAHSGISFSWDDVNQKLTATVTTENVQDSVAGMLTSGTHTGISFTYGPTQDAANRIDAAVDPEFIQDTVNDLLNAGVHTGITFSYSDSLNALSATVNFSGNMGGNLGSNLVLNSKDITGTGNINVTGTGTFSGTVTSGAVSTSSVLYYGGIPSPTTALTLTAAEVTVGTTAVPLELRVIAPKDLGINIRSVSPAALDGGGLLGFNITSGTHTAPTKIVAEALMGGISFNGYNGTTYKNGAAIFAQVAPGTDTTGVNNIKTNLILATSDGAGSIAIGLTVRNDHVAESPCFRATPFADATARSTAIPTPQAGMITYLTSTNKLQAYNGSAWVDLH